MKLLPFVFTSMLNEENLFADDFYDIKFWTSQTSQVFLDNQIKISHNTLHVSWDYMIEILEPEMIKIMFDFYEEQIVNFSENITKIKNIKPNLKHAYILGTQKNFSNDLKINENVFSNYIFEGLSDSELILEKNYNKYLKIIKNYKKRNKVSKIRITINSNKNPKNLAMILAAWSLNDSICCINEEKHIWNDTILLSDSNLIFNCFENTIIEKKNYKKINKNESYVLFTSGTTGIPKGVSVSFASMLNTVNDIIDRYKINEDDIIANVSKWSFDLSIFDIVLPIILNCKTIFYNNINIINDFSKITVWNSTPKIFEYFQKKINFPKLRLVFLSGDNITYNILKNKNMKYRLISLGGATEAGIWSVYHEIIDRIEYGKPLANQNICVVDKNNNILPNGIQGELLISGKSLFTNYINQSYEFTYINNEKWYRTGDLTINFANTGLRFLGRINEEYKLNGYRIDINYVEKQIINYTSLDEIAVHIYKKNNNDVLYCLYTGKKINDIKNLLKNKMTDYLIPKVFINIDKFKLTQNGKKDVNFINETIKLFNDSRISRKLTETEIEISKIWNYVLDKDIEYDYYESFFEVGGNSLHANNLIFEINNKFKTNISIHLLFENNTLQDLAKLVKISEKTEELNENLILIRKGTTNQKIVLIHAGSGEIAIYYQFCNYVDKKYSIYAIKYDKKNLNLEPKMHSFSHLAKKYNKYIQNLKNIDFIGGWCIGGTIGYEMLLQKKYSNTKLLLINTLPPNQKNNSENHFELKEEIKFINSFAPILDTKINFNNVEELWKFIQKLARKDKSIFNLLKSVVPENLKRLIPYFESINDSDLLIQYINLFRGFEATRYNYLANSKIQNNAIYFNATKEPVENFYIWENLTSNLLLIPIEESHTGIIEEEGIKKIVPFL